MEKAKRAWLVLLLLAGLEGSAAGAGSGLRMTGPYAHLNLEVFLIHGRETAPGQRYMTLTEALEHKLVVVHETGSVQQLAIENKGRLPVFIQSGDIVKGGRQDRVLRSDMIVPARSGRIPLASFCVESGRWRQRGAEDAGRFASNSAMVSSRELKLAARHLQDQGAVWSGVAEQQTKLNTNLRRMKGDRSLDVRAGKSATSLQLTLEHGDLREMAAAYKRVLAGLLDGKPDAVGFALVVNGQVSAAEVYGRRDLFRALWPKLLDSAVVEAISEYSGTAKEGGASRRPEALEAVSALLSAARAEQVSTRDPSGRTRVVIREQGQHLVFETRDRALADALVHSSYIEKIPMRSTPRAPLDGSRPPARNEQLQQRAVPGRGPLR
ncbi:MAG: hypothetical protein JXR96_09690 [Deltaproteobacteria bacterium]|nr:hypothetical protein [Deltaproteobacteria bacterium]